MTFNSYRRRTGLSPESSSISFKKKRLVFKNRLVGLLFCFFTAVQTIFNFSLHTFSKRLQDFCAKTRTRSCQNLRSGAVIDLKVGIHYIPSLSIFF